MRSTVAALLGSLRVDLADPQARAGLRTRIMLGAIVPSALLPLLGAIGLLGDFHDLYARWLNGAMFAAMAVVMILMAVRRGRMGELDFLALQCLGHLLGVVNASILQPGMRLPFTAMADVLAVVLSALLMERRAFLVGQMGLALVLLAVIAFPLGDADQTISFLWLSAFVLGLTAFAMRLLRELALNAITSARKREVTDVLTGLTNRRGLERAGAEVWTRSAAVQHSVAALVVDVDHFKRINDTQGHAAGDEVLRRLGSLPTASLRDGDVAFRLGGEEFLLLCPTPPGGGLAIAERLRATIERDMAPVTASIGIFESAPLAERTFPEALWTAVDTADQALYQAKNSGRNRAIAIP